MPNVVIQDHGRRPGGQPWEWDCFSFKPENQEEGGRLSIAAIYFHQEIVENILLH